jgi:nucleoside-diphosphate-sugar epimerase
MYRVLVTGAFGNIGRSAVAAHLEAGDEVRALEMETPRNRRLASRLGREWDRKGSCRIVFGDVRDPKTAEKAVEGVDAIVHLAALIPPKADLMPDLARSINIGGTANLITAASRIAPRPRFVLASSIAAYGDRVDDYWIKADDRLVASPGDAYAESKIEAERLVRESGLPFSILRLTYIVWRKKLQLDPLLFHMPLRTKIEICHTEDTGRAFAAAARSPEALGRTFDIGGGEACRTTYREYLDRMMRLFGLGGAAFLPEEAFASSGFHCGWYADSDEAESLLRFRRKGLEDYYKEVKEEAALTRIVAALARPIVRAALAAKSPFLRRATSV